MPTTPSSREFNHDTSGAKKAARSGPVFIKDRGRPAHVPLSIDWYLRLAGGNSSIIDVLAMPEAEGIELDPPRTDIKTRQVDLS
ncbi:type II toxin-antitoxin system Phd/YefM family antitoxin [Stutzerimonas nitrititolerans]|uniref:type II toxin-antitoxin system Phd/YefM family antitoxin n=1 Tax=Stutzerimonas nitrititolerans TaxID=2482751 RepID=UPI00289D72DB|nr:type II toxin-antitoxin system Phd/YefM family antitoxin [Stutzerimonas nitrititolerans]